MTAERSTDHAGLIVLTPDECGARLRAGQVGRVAFPANGEIEVFPVAYAADGLSVAFRTAVGSKLTAALEQATVTFEIDGFDASRRDGWSVVIKGTCEPVRDDAVIARLDAAGGPWWLGPEGEPRWVQVRANSITGRRIPEPSPAAVG